MNHNTTVEDRLARLERTASRWRGVTMGLVGVGIGALLLGFGQNGTPPQAGKSAVRVDNNGFAVIEDANGEWSVVYQAGIGVFKSVTPQR